jgi:hypothetical protein
MTGTGLLRLLPQHIADLTASGLNDKTISTWGAYSIEIDQKGVLVQLGFGHIDPPALALPILPPDRIAPDLDVVMVKPDHPRRDNNGHAVKYEARARSRNRIHVPLSIRSMLVDVHVPLVITEGQKKAEKAAQEGICAVALAGVWNWKDRIGEASFPIGDFELFPLAGRRVVLCFDSDALTNASVRKAEDDLAAYLSKRLGAQTSIKRLPPGNDGSKVGLDDFLLVHSVEEFRRIAEEAPGSNARSLTAAVTVHERHWPEPLAPEGMHGPAGEFVRIVSPHTEADEAGLLTQFLAFFGNAAGRNSTFQHEADQHAPNINVVLVGDTASGRKGTALSQVRRLFNRVDCEWATTRIQSGLSSGEGLIWAVRDPIERTDPIKEKGRVVGYETVIADQGVTDKRLLVIETELSSPLKVADREGNTLTGVVRQAWDSGSLRLMTKNNPAQSTGAHISIIGHIPGNELLRFISTTELGNGFANRFLWICVRRSKLLPDGGTLEDEDLESIVQAVRKALEFARIGHRVRRCEQARKAWHAVYEALSSQKPGLLGAVISRAEAQITRLATIYALLDRSPVIQEVHLKAALAVWEYVEASVRFIFGDTLGDPVADAILSALQANTTGLTRAQINDLFKHNREKGSIDNALTTLAKQSLAHSVREETGGRPSERWVAQRLKGHEEPK